MLGGAIEKTVRFKDIQSRAPYTDTIDKIMKEQAYLKGPPVMKEFMHGVADYRFRIMLPFGSMIKNGRNTQRRGCIAVP